MILLASAVWALTLQQSVAAQWIAPEQGAADNATSSSGAVGPGALRARCLSHPHPGGGCEPPPAAHAAQKRGVAWQLGDAGTLAPFAPLASYYTYSPHRRDSALPFVPMLWGCTDEHVREFQACVANLDDGASAPCVCS